MDSHDHFSPNAHSTTLTSNNYFTPLRETHQRNNFFSESPNIPPKPFAMDVDCSNEGTISSGSSIVSTSQAKPTRLKPKMSPNANRNKVSCSF